MTVKRYPCGDYGCAGCQDGAACDHVAGAPVRPPAARDRPPTHDRRPTGGVAYSELPAVKRAVAP